MAKEARISRLLTTETVQLHLKKPREWNELIVEFGEEDANLPSIKERREQIIEELTDLLMPSGNVQHRNKLLIDLINRERKASTALGHGIAVPHVRTKHARDLVIGFARSDFPIDWDAPDGMPVDLFFVMVAPSFDDRIYTKIWSKFASILSVDSVREELRNASDPGEIIRILRLEE
jgi:mannitol/fructose-specific phosphotransferase system IIA component (Ntr-type)